MICKLLQLQWFYNCKKKQNVNFLLSHTVGLDSFGTDGTVSICVLYFYNVASVTDELKTS